MAEKNKKTMSRKQDHFVTGRWRGQEVVYRERQLIVGISPPAGIGDRFQQFADQLVARWPGFEILHYRPGGRRIVVRIPEEQDLERVAALITTRQHIRYAEPNAAGFGLAEPDDPRYLSEDQWACRNINLIDAWADGFTGDANVVIGVMDSGLPMPEDGLPVDDAGEIDLDALVEQHEDLDWARFLFGSDLTGEDAAHRDYIGHGSCIAGIVGAKTDNGVGIAAVDWAASVYFCRILNAENETDTDRASAAIEEIADYAAATGRRTVINVSVAFSSDYTTVAEACRKSVDAGVTLCCGSGNTAGSVVYPARYSATMPGVIAVGSTTEDDTPAFSSAKGSEVTCAAPGDPVLSTVPEYELSSNPYSIGFDETGYGWIGGTSIAAPHATGVVALMLARNDKISPEGIVECLVQTANMPSGLASDDVLKMGAGLIDAYAALQAVVWDVELETPSIEIVAEEGATESVAIQIRVKSCEKLTFTITDGPSVTAGAETGAVFGTPLGTEATYDLSGGAAGYGYVELWVDYTGTSDGDAAEGTVRVQCDQAGFDQTINITASTTAPVTSAVVMVLDKSGSMTSSSGVGGLSRADLLQYSAKILLDYIPQDHAVGIVTFDEDAADVAAITRIDTPEPDTGNRATLKGLIDAYAPTPGGLTAIGDGVRSGNDKFSGVSGYGYHAMVVFTDGKETAADYIEDVDDLISERSYAIGLGTADAVEPAALNDLVNATGGYQLITDTLGDEAEYKLSKYFLQIFAGVTNEDILVDPTDRIAPGHLHEIPFRVTRVDRRIDVICMMPTAGVINVELIPPSGPPITSSGLDPRSEPAFVSSDRLAFFRMHLPVDGRHEGEWRIRLTVDGDEFDAYMGRIQPEDPNSRRHPVHGILYSLLVHARSGLKFRARALQDSLEPGGDLRLFARLSHNAIPLPHRRASVEAAVTFPDGRRRTIALRPTAPGEYAATVRMLDTGVYICRVMARGTSLDLDPFMREQVITGYAWPGGDAPRPSSRP